MRSDNNSSIDPSTGNVTWEGELTIEKGNHNNMPARTDAYLPGDERGHINASSLGGKNTTANVVPQNADVNHGAYASMERGERSALQNGDTINSDKTAFVNSQPGARPSAFIANDNVTYPDGHTESVHHSFANASYAEQQAWNDQAAALPGTFDAPNPGDGLRGSMTAEEYADLMETTDAELPGIAEDYAPTTSADPTNADTSTSASDDTSSDTSSADASADAGETSGDDSGADCGPDE